MMLPTRTFEQFNDAQRHALDTGRNLAVRAGAGSGKTSVLVERIVQLLATRRADAEPLRLDAIVALTFTRKAAAQLQERLQRAFEEQARVGDADFWRARAAELPAAMIGTIDAFCARVLREFSHLHPLDDAFEPGFEPLSSYDEILLKQQAVERVLDRLHSLPDDEPDPENRVRADAARWWGENLGYETLSRYLVTLLFHVVDPGVIVAAHAALGPVRERVAADWEALPVVRRLREESDRLREDLAMIVHDIDARDDAGDNMERLRTRLLAVLAALDLGTREGEEQALATLTDALLTGERTPRLQGLNKLAELVKPLQDAWCPLLERFSFDFDAEVRAREAGDRLALLLEPVHEEFQRLCRAEGRYDFLTLARRTRDLLRRAPAARKALQERYRYLMVDEFQDTNHLQWEILSWLVGEGPTGVLERDRLFLVGDPQQSIYRFRHADVSVFNAVQDRVKAANALHGHIGRPTDYEAHAAAPPATDDQRLGLMPLRENYRTHAPMPLEIVDRVFMHVFDPAVHKLADNPFEVEYQPLIAGLADALPGEVCYVLPKLPDEEEDDPEAEELPAESVALPQVQMVVDRLVALHGAPRLAPRAGEAATLRWADMAILLPSRDVVLTELEREFRRRGVPFLVHKGIGFWQRQEVRDVVSLALCLADPGDDVSLFATLRGPVCQLADGDIFFLAQVGGRLGRGLAQLAARADAAAADLSDLDGWANLPGAARLALSQHWLRLAPDQRARIAEAARRVQAWRQGVDRAAHADLLQRVLEESGAYALHAAESEADAIFANLGKVFDTIRDREAGTPTSLTALAYELRDRVNDAEKEEQAPAAREADAVQVMTVHAAKGLEFPVVAVMKLDRRAVRPMSHRLRVLSPTEKLLAADAADIPNAAGGTLAVAVRHPRRPREMYVPRLLRALADLDKAQALAESRRLFYVAATRARERLILAGRQPRTTTGRVARIHESWQRWFEEALGISDDDKARGFWEDGVRHHRVTIVTSPAEDTAEVRAAPFVPPGQLDLAPVVSPPRGQVVRMDDLLASGRNAGIVGAVVQRVLAEGQPRGRLRAESLRGLAADVLQSWSMGELPADPGRVAEIALQAAEVLQLLEETSGTRARTLLTAAGLDDVPFRLNLAGGIVLGCFDRLVTKGAGYEGLVWTEGEADEEACLPLLALALEQSGRAALNEGRVILHRLRVDGVDVKAVGFTRAGLDGLAGDWQRRLTP